MADTITTTFDLKYPQKVGGYGKIGVISGTATISSYSTSKVPVAAITGLFRNTFRVVVDGVSSGGYAMRWDNTAQAFRAYLQTGTAAVLTEAGSAANIGNFNFVAIGQIATGG